MARPKGTFKTPEQLLLMTPEQRRAYKVNHEKYRRRSERLARLRAERKGEKTYIRTWQQRQQDKADEAIIEWDKFPETMLREYFRTHCPTQGTLRVKTDRWETNNSSIAKFIMGKKLLSAKTLAMIALDTGITIERILADFQEGQVKKNDKTPSESSGETT